MENIGERKGFVYFIKNLLIAGFMLSIQRATYVINRCYLHCSIPYKGTCELKKIFWKAMAHVLDCVTTIQILFTMMAK